MVKYLALVLAACSVDPQTSAVSQALLGGDCVDPRDYGAIVDDGLDDMAAIQMAIDAALATSRPVCLPTGTLNVTKRPGTGLANVASLTVSGDGLTIYGQGDYSRIAMLGGAAGDWWTIRISGSNHTLRNFSIDGAGRGTTSEQTHLAQILGPASNITLESLRLNLPSLGPSTGGDCIRAAGEQAVGSSPATPVEGLVIDKVRGIECDRSFIGLQRWVYGVRITNSSSQIVGDQVVDTEVTGFGNVGDVVIRDCRFRRNGLGDATALSLGGSSGGADPGFDILVERTTVDGSILIYDAGNVTLRNVRAVSSGAAPTLDIKKRSDHVVVEASHLEHKGTIAGPVVNVSYFTSAWPHFVTIRKSHLIQRTEDHLVRAEPAQGLAVESNEMECLGPVANTYAAVFARATVAMVTGVVVGGNTVTGNCKQLARLAATASYGIGVSKIRDNDSQAVTTGVLYENGTPSAKPSVDSNSFGSLPLASHVVGAGTNGYIGTN